MVATLQLVFGPAEAPPVDKISTIVREAYDFQKDHMSYDDRKNSSGSHIFDFRFYLNECDQPARTIETLRKLQDLIVDYL